jgi:YfiR/HmsC-like
MILLRLRRMSPTSQRSPRVRRVNGLPRLVLALLCLLTAATGKARGQMDEYSVKAGYLYNFTKYVTWPDEAFASTTAPFVICILGRDPFEGRLDQAIAGKSSGNGKPLQVKRLNTMDRAAFRDCQVLFVSKSERDHAADIVWLLKETPTFTVGDFDSFAQQGGIADLRLEGTRIKVDLNVNAAVHANLKISARLQQVANLVP